MSQLENRPPIAAGDPGVRRSEYVRWRQRLADKQDELRAVDAEPVREVDPRWSPEALFRAHDDAVDGGGEPAGPLEAAASGSAGTVDLTDVADPSARPGHLPVGDEATEEPALDLRVRRTSVEDLLRRVGSASGPRPTFPPTPTAAARRDGSSTAVAPTPARVSVGEELRELNRRRVEGELSDAEFNRRKRELFIRTSTQRRPPT